MYLCICVSLRVAKHLGYKHIIFTNNDVLVPSGAIDLIRKVLPGQPIVVPLTTELGAGHNPAQVSAGTSEGSLLDNYVVLMVSVRWCMRSLFATHTMYPRLGPTT